MVDINPDRTPSGHSTSKRDRNHVSYLLFCVETAFQDGHWLQKSGIRTERSIHVKSARQDMRSHEPLVIVRISAKATMLAH